MKYLVTKFENCDEVLSSYCHRNADAVVIKDENSTKIYIEFDKIISVKRFKSFCEYTLPYIRSSKPKHEFYKAEVVFPLINHIEALFGAAEPWTVKDQLKLESSVQFNKYCFLYSGKGVKNL